MGNKFVYANVTREVQTPVVKKHLEALCLAGICNKVLQTDANGIPLLAESDLLKTSFKALESVEDLTHANSGGIQLVGKGLRMICDPWIDTQLFYWIRTSKRLKC